MFLAATNLVNLVGIVAAVAGVASVVVAAFVAIRKYRPERDSLYITSAQGAAVILNNLVTTLRAEVEDRDKEIARLGAEMSTLKSLNAELVTENVGLRSRKGTRHAD